MQIERQWKLGLGAAIGLLAGPAWVVAQVAISLTLPSGKAILYEDVVAQVTIQNNSGQMLTMDSRHGPVRFWLDVEHDGGRAVPRCDNAPLVSDVAIMPGEIRSFGFNVPRLYAVRKQGVYKIRADVEMNGMHYVSPEAILEISAGFEIQRLTSGVSGDTHAVRTYVLSYFQKDNGEFLYLRIEDSDQAIYGLFNLGRIIRVRPLECKLDEAGNLHVLFQTAGMGYVHTAFTPFGVQLFAKSYAGVRGMASLTQQPNGQIAVLDGIETAAPAPDAAPSAEEKAALEKAKKKIGSGGLIGQMMNSSGSKP